MNLDPDIISDYDFIINDYLRDFPKITKHDLNVLIEKNSYDYDFVHFKIVDNKIYQCNHIKEIKGFSERIDAFKCMLFKTLEKYTIPDCEFVIYLNDAINDRMIHDYMDGERLLPIIITTSILDKYNMILCPDFTFTYSNFYYIKNNEEMCKTVVEKQENTIFDDKYNKIVWRGAGHNNYRSQYLRVDDYFDIQHAFMMKGNNLTREEKSNYKYQLHLNGHEGNNVDGAYSSAFKWALMGKSFVIYSAPDFYREFWLHPSIIRNEEHYLYTTNIHEFQDKYNDCLMSEIRNVPYINNRTVEDIAIAGFDFFKKYLLDYNYITYYMQKLLSEYAKRQDFTVNLFDGTDYILIDKDKIFFEPPNLS